MSTRKKADGFRSRRVLPLSFTFNVCHFTKRLRTPEREQKTSLLSVLLPELTPPVPEDPSTPSERWVEGDMGWGRSLPPVLPPTPLRYEKFPCLLPPLVPPRKKGRGIPKSRGAEKVPSSGLTIIHKSRIRTLQWKKEIQSRRGRCDGDVEEGRSGGGRIGG